MGNVMGGRKKVHGLILGEASSGKTTLLYKLV